MFELGIELNKIGVDEKSICRVLKPAVNLDFIAENAKIIPSNNSPMFPNHVL